MPNAIQQFYVRFGRPVRMRIRRVHLRAVGSRLRRNGGFILNQRGIRLFVDPSDERAQRLALSHGLLATEVADVWARLAADLSPDLVIDVGANYGEVTFSTAYGPRTSVHLVEANPRVAPFLRRTLEEAACGYVLHEGAASSDAGEVILNLGDSSSGLSSITRRMVGTTHVTVTAFRLDERIPAGYRVGLLKLDVEGHELRVLEGAERLLTGLADFAVVCELNPEAIDELAGILESFSVYLLDKEASMEYRASLDDLNTHVTDWQASRYRRDVILRPRSNAT